MPRIPQTLHNLNPFDCLSAMQKCIRRGLEREAMQFACELGHTSKAFATMVGNRLEIISHEDVGLAAPELIPLVHVSCQQAKAFYDRAEFGKWRMPIGTAVRALCRAPKSREGDHFNAAIGLPNELHGVAPEVPDWAYDHHTTRGRKLGRGVEYFRTESTKLVPPPDGPDPYEAEAFAQFEARAKQPKASQPSRPRASRGSTGRLFD
jgi:replication-associated recombination protein RarA